MKDASGKGEEDCWFGENGRHESSEMESGSILGTRVVAKEVHGFKSAPENT